MGPHSEYSMIPQISVCVLVTEVVKTSSRSYCRKKREEMKLSWELPNLCKLMFDVVITLCKFLRKILLKRSNFKDNN